MSIGKRYRYNKETKELEEVGEVSSINWNAIEFPGLDIYSGVPSGQKDGVVFKNKRHYDDYKKSHGFITKDW